MALRPHFKFGEAFKNLVRHCPWITEDHLQDLSKRKSLAEILNLKQDMLGLKLLGQALKNTICKHKVVAINNILDVREGDMTRFKRSHRGVLGLVGHAQVTSIFFNTPHYSFKQLEGYAQILSLPSEQRKGFEHALTTQIERFRRKVGRAWNAIYKNNLPQQDSRL